MSENMRGSLFMILAMAAFSVEDMLFKSLTQALPTGQVLTLFGVFGTCAFAVLLFGSGQSIWHRGMIGRIMAVRSLCELAGRLFFALALALTPLSSASAILQATPLFVTLGAVLFLGQTVGWRRWVAMSVGFGGVLLILRPGLEGFQPESIFALLGTLGFAGRDLATRASAPALGDHHLGLVGFLVLFVAGLTLWMIDGRTAPMSAPELGTVGVVTIVGLFAYSALTKAMRKGDVAVIAPFRYTRLLFAIVLGIAVFGERPDLLTLIGGAVIVGTGIFTLVRQNAERAKR